MEQLVAGRWADPFAVLGAHQTPVGTIVRSLQPGAVQVDVIYGNRAISMRMVHPAGLFEAACQGDLNDYQLRIHKAGGEQICDDPYRFPSPLGELDRYLAAQGRHSRLQELFGARPMKLMDVSGVYFAVWAPNAGRVSVVGDFNDWDGRVHVMRHHPGSGIWDLFIPGLSCGARYKFELLDSVMQLLPLKSDPWARYIEQPPGNASIVFQDAYEWRDDQWMRGRDSKRQFFAPMCIYEVHLGSWARVPEQDGRSLGYAELAQRLIPYVREQGFSHIELLPVMEHPFGGSWGYQPTGLFAPTSRFGTPDDFRRFVDACHRAGIGVILDWVPGHFPHDAHGLARFDGTALYEHEDPRQGLHPDWGTAIYNFERNEVVNFLLANAAFWISSFHIDALRVDAVASMLYLDYSRKAGEWIPNRDGSNQNLAAIEFLRRLNCDVHALGAFTIAEESTSWPGVSRPVESGGLGFSFKWNMGWMNDTLRYVREDPVHRRHHHELLTFGMLYAYSENFILPVSHDEVVHGKGSLLSRMPGDEWQQFANVRSYLSFQYGFPGKKLLFMGCEFAQRAEWAHDRSLDWHLLADSRHAGVQRLVRDLNHLLVNQPALYAADHEASGFCWLSVDDRDASVLAFLRLANEAMPVVVAVNFTPVPRRDYRIGLPRAGQYHELLNSDATEYGGGGIGNLGCVHAEARPWAGFPASAALTLPPLAAVFLGLESR
ncbi:MAG: 1,4-alpha-glucan branching protein GlgB [Steroidobacteraceae bacterium]